MKVIVNDNGKSLGRSVMDENSDYYEEVVPMGRVGGKYDFIMMVGDGEVYGFEGERIHFHPIGDQEEPIGFQWQPALNRDVDFNWLPLDDEVEYDDGGFYDE